MSDVPTFKLVIGGKAVDAKSGKTQDIENPAGGPAAGRAAWGGVEDAEAAIEAAARAFASKDWREMDGGKRVYLLRKLSDLVRKDLENLARLETMQMGKPIRESRVDIGYVSSTLAYYAGLADKVEGATIPVPGARFDFTIREPLGVTAHIAPWNFPLLLAVRGVAPALAAGNTVVLKPASWTPLTALRFGELATEAGFPEGVVNVVAGPGNAVGDALAGSADVASITFTGSVETGQTLMKRAAANVTPVTLELGGKSPQLVLEDADIDRAVKGTVYGIFQNAGQMCWATSRLIVHESIAEEYFGKVKERAQGLRVGDPLDEKTEMGPLARASHRETVHGFVEKGKQEGAKLLTGGKALSEGALAKGAYYAPTVFTGVPRTSVLAREEVFGPVLASFTFRDVDEALAIANDTTFGLFSAVWTRDIAKAFQVAKALEAGMVCVNEPPITFPQTPFTGWKHSGVGSEQGVDALRAYTRTKNVTIGLR